MYVPSVGAGYHSEASPTFTPFWPSDCLSWPPCSPALKRSPATEILQAVRYFCKPLSLLAGVGNEIRGTSSGPLTSGSEPASQGGTAARCLTASR